MSLRLFFQIGSVKVSDFAVVVQSFKHTAWVKMLYFSKSLRAFWFRQFNFCLVADRVSYFFFGLMQIETLDLFTTFGFC